MQQFGRVLLLTLTAPMYSVMVAEVGEVGEKGTEYRANSDYWKGRLCLAGNTSQPREYDYVMCFGGVNVPMVDADWFVARFKSSRLRTYTTTTTTTTVGPYTNGAKKSFTGDVWEIELGVVVRNHKKKCTLSPACPRSPEVGASLLLLGTPLCNYHYYWQAYSSSSKSTSTKVTHLLLVLAVLNVALLTP